MGGILLSVVLLQVQQPTEPGASGKYCVLNLIAKTCSTLISGVFAMTLLYHSISEYERILYSKHDSTMYHCMSNVRQHVLKEYLRVHIYVFTVYFIIPKWQHFTFIFEASKS